MKIEGRNSVYELLKTDKEIEDFFKSKKLNLEATLDEEYAYKNADFVVVSTPTNYDINKSYFDTTSVESVIKKIIKNLKSCKNVLI